MTGCSVPTASPWRLRGGSSRPPFPLGQSAWAPGGPRGFHSAEGFFFPFSFPILLPGKDFRNFSASALGASESIFTARLTNCSGLQEPGKSCGCQKALHVPWSGAGALEQGRVGSPFEALRGTF